MLISIYPTFCVLFCLVHWSLNFSPSRQVSAFYHVIQTHNGNPVSPSHKCLTCHVCFKLFEQMVKRDVPSKPKEVEVRVELRVAARRVDFRTRRSYPGLMWRPEMRTGWSECRASHCSGLSFCWFVWRVKEQVKGTLGWVNGESDSRRGFGMNLWWSIKICFSFIFVFLHNTCPTFYPHISN